MPRQTIRPFSLRLALFLWLCLMMTGAIRGEDCPAPRVNATAEEALTDANITTMLRDYIDLDKLGVGLVVGILDEHGTQIVSYGRLDNGTDSEVNGDTVFGIASITKVFTALLLQDMIERGQMKLDDPVQKYLPGNVKLPTYHGRQITLLHLATHTSGLPRDCDDDLYAFLSHCTLRQAPGTHWEYSNLGMGLLGHVIALKAGEDYETLVIKRICQPLGMNDTRITLTPELKMRLAIGHAMPGCRVRDFLSSRHETNAQAPNLFGAGSLRSTANDLLKFVGAYSGLTPSPLSPLMHKARAPHSLETGATLALAWEGDGPVFEHGGLSDGYQAELAFDVKRRRGVVVLSNCANYGTFVPGVWRALLDGRSPRPPGTVPIEAKVYDRYVGQYVFEKSSARCTVRREGERLLLQWLGKPGDRRHIPSFEVFPQSESVFRNDFRQVLATFLTTKHQPPRLVLTGLGSRSGLQGSIELGRVSTDIPASPAAFHIDPDIYDRYVGRYRKTFLFGLIRVGPTLSISRADDELGSHLVASVRGLGTEEIFPTSETNFIPGFNVTDDLRMTFVRIRKGKAKDVNVHWNGKEYRGTRISSKP